jgi:hypothetical protein
MTLVCDVGYAGDSIPSATKLASVGLVASFATVGIGAFSLGMKFLPSSMAMAIVVLGAIAFAACLVFIILKREKHFPSTKACMHMETLRGDRKMYIRVDTPDHSCVRIELDSRGDGTALMEKLKEKFSGIMPSLELSLFGDEHENALLSLKKILPHIAFLGVFPGPKAENNKRLALSISSLSMLREIRIVPIKCEGCISIAPMEILRVVENCQTLRKVSFSHAAGINLTNVGPEVDSFSLISCIDTNAKPVLENRKWKKIAIIESGSGDAPATDRRLFSENAVPEKIITEELEISLGIISRNPGLLGRFSGVRSLVLKADKFTENEDMHGIFNALLQYDQLTEITLVATLKFDKFPEELLRIIKQIRQLKKFTILRERFHHQHYDRAIITDEIKEALLEVNPGLEIVEEDCICGYGVGP